MARNVWREDELAVLADAFHRGAKINTLEVAGRTIGAIKVRMSRFRDQAGHLSDGRRERAADPCEDMRAFNSMQKSGSRQLLAAIVRAGLRP